MNTTTNRTTNPALLTFDIYRVRSTARYADTTCLPRSAFQFQGTVAATTRREAFTLAARDDGKYLVVPEGTVL